MYNSVYYHAAGPVWFSVSAMLFLLTDVSTEIGQMFLKKQKKKQNDNDAL